MVRAKFKVHEVKTTAVWGGSSEKESQSVVLVPASGDENKEWSRWTPSGRIEMTINNPAAFEQFKVGEHFYVDFSPAPAAG